MNFQDISSTMIECDFIVVTEDYSRYLLHDETTLKG